MAEKNLGDLLQPIHPGEILRDLFLEPLGMSAGALAYKLNVPRGRIARLAAERSAITADTALRLAKFFDTTPQLWMNMQVSYDLKIVARDKADDLSAIPVLPSAQ